MFLPMTPEEIRKLGWQQPDVILVTGDAYIDSPSIGVSVIGHALTAAGFKVAVIAQPDVKSDADIARLGEPRLFWGVTGGSVDSMVANYTASGKPRRSDDYTPGGTNDRRPDRAVIAYANLIRKYFKKSAPIVLGGIEASLRRIAHYDFWSDSVRRSVLFDAKADVLVYGMGERAVVELARRFDAGDEWRDIPGICYASKEPPADYIELPSYEETAADNAKFNEAFKIFYENLNPYKAKGVVQLQDTRWLVQNPPDKPFTPTELDAVYELPYERSAHSSYAGKGAIRALDTIAFSITTHRGCVGECYFCAIHPHQGRYVVSRSEDSIVREAARIAGMKHFRGVIPDAGGPTANMYGIACAKHPERNCRTQSCMFPKICKNLSPAHKRHAALLARLGKIPGVKHVFVASGLRYDLILADEADGENYMKALLGGHISGQFKIAPEHSEDSVLEAMGKPETRKSLPEFLRMAKRVSEGLGKPLYPTYYFIAAHPGSGERESRRLAEFISKELRIKPEQAQIFMPTPMTVSSAMYYTGSNPITGRSVFVEKNLKRKELQKKLITG